MQIIVRSRYTEKERRQVEVARQNLAGYYKEECDKGSRFFSKLTKATIKKVYEDATDISSVRAASEQARAAALKDGNDASAS
jgi:hypothetical protein